MPWSGDDCGPPDGGGFIILNASEIGCWDLVCAIKSRYRQTKILAQTMLEHSDDYAKSKVG